jgi:hypothetical protein
MNYTRHAPESIDFGCILVVVQHYHGRLTIMGITLYLLRLFRLR